MRFDLKAPCGNCPFRTDVEFFIGAERIEQICESITTGDKTFSCHKTTRHGDDGEAIYTTKEQHCAGALVMLAKMNASNGMLRIAKRLGIYEPGELRMDSPVFESADAMIEHYHELNDRG